MGGRGPLRNAVVMARRAADSVAEGVMRSTT